MELEAYSYSKISIHALREEGDPARRQETEGQKIFLSTPSARRATFAPPLSVRHPIFLSTPSARRATDHQRDGIAILEISIHALREEGDPPALWYTRRA